MDAVLHDPTFWVAISFVIFVAAAYRPLRRVMVGALDGRAEKIREQIDEAARLRDEAQAMLAKYKRKQRDAAKEAVELMENAKTEAKRLRDQAETDLAALLKRREQQAMERIAQAEAQAVAEIRGMAVDLAVAATRRILSEKVTGDRASALIDESIEAVGNKLH